MLVTDTTDTDSSTSYFDLYIGIDMLLTKKYDSKNEGKQNNNTMQNTRKVSNTHEPTKTPELNPGVWDW